MERSSLRDRAIEKIMEKMGVQNPSVTDVHRAFFSTIRYSVLVRPLVLDYLDTGRTIADATRKFQLTRRQVENIVQKKEENYVSPD